jgi:hypothetical protein
MKASQIYVVRIFAWVFIYYLGELKRLSRRLFITETRVRSQVSPYEIFERQVTLGQVFFRVVPVPLSFHQHSILIFIYTLLLPEGPTVES